jgi:hypothetical protein
MKLIRSKALSPFGGLNFVLEELDIKNIGRTFNKNLPKLNKQSQYDWRDLIYSYFSIYFCGGDCAEDLASNFRPSLTQLPFLKVPSPDRVF